MKSIDKNELVLSRLKNDSEYYGSYGKNWLSNSDISTLLQDPLSFRLPKEKTKAMLEGNYFHTLMLEPQKLDDFQVIDCSTRSTKLYKEALSESKEDMLILQSEVDNLNKCADAMKQNLVFCDAIYKDGNEFEVPQVTTYMGVEWKGKADIVSDNILIDIKTTSSISDFRWKASKFNYDSQAFIYQMLFGKPLHFYVVDKVKHTLGIYEPTDMFLASGQEKVERAVEVYNTFFIPNATEDVNQYIHYEDL